MHGTLAPYKGCTYAAPVVLLRGRLVQVEGEVGPVGVGEEVVVHGLHLLQAVRYGRVFWWDGHLLGLLFVLDGATFKVGHPVTGLTDVGLAVHLVAGKLGRRGSFSCSLLIGILLVGY